jgi:hypothetical protein
MENNNYEIDLSGPPVNPAIRHLWNLENTGYAFHKRACQAYSQWLVNYDEPQIAVFFKVAVTETKADLAYIRALLPEEAITLHIRERNEIRASRERSKRVHDEIAADLSFPAKTLLERGQDPADVLRRYREATEYEAPADLKSGLPDERNSYTCKDGKEGEITEDPIPVRELRRQNSQTSIDESAGDIAERDNQRIAVLRNEVRSPAKRIIPEGHFMREYPTSPIANRQAQCNPDQKSAVNKADRRITFRMNPALHEKAQKYCRDAGLDLSTLMREATSQYLDGDTASNEKTNSSMPAEALARIGRYQIAGSNLKENLRENFLQLLAQAYVTTGRWQTKWVKELYRALLPLYQILEDENVRQP